jgi:hypothetical protein
MIVVNSEWCILIGISDNELESIFLECIAQVHPCYNDPLETYIYTFHHAFLISIRSK